MKQLTIIFFMLFPFVMLQAQNANAVTNHLGASNTISFQKKAYNLAWSSHPATNYYKQEYVTNGDSVAHFKTMLLLEAVTGSVTLKEMVAAKAAELNALQEKNPVVQYQVFDNAKTGEYMIDFLLSAHAPDGSISIIERSVYRYKKFAGKKGTTGILLFGVSERSYGEEAQSFLLKLKKDKTVLVNAVAAMPWPSIKL